MLLSPFPGYLTSASPNPVKGLQYLSSTDQPLSPIWPQVFRCLSSHVLLQPVNHFPPVYLWTLPAFNEVFILQDHILIFLLPHPLALALAVINWSQTLKLESYKFHRIPAPCLLNIAERVGFLASLYSFLVSTKPTPCLQI